MTKGIAKTKETWQGYCVQELTDDDALEIEANLLGFITLLLEWEQEESTSNKGRTGYGNDDL